jgi:hypothetical protein
MTTMLGFTAFAIDLGQRNQLLSRAQASIDASVLAAGQYLANHPGDYVGASKRVKDVLSQNIGIDDWRHCTEAQPLPITATTDVALDNTCISFALISDGGQDSYNVKVVLPDYEMDTIFSGAIGVSKINLSASAGADGSDCTDPTAPGCSGSGGGGGNTSTTSSTAVAPTTTTLEQFCAGQSPLSLVLDSTTFDRCSWYYPGLDRLAWTTTMCNDMLAHTETYNVPYTVNTINGPMTYWFQFNPVIYVGGDMMWNMFCGWANIPGRDVWLNTFCWGDLAPIYVDLAAFQKCAEIRPSLEPWASWYSTTTTTTSTAPLATSSTTTSSTTTLLPPSSTTPTTIDLNA